MKLTNNFSLEEMTRSSKAVSLGVSNSPNVEQLANLKALCENVLQPIRERFGRPIKVNSGFRCKIVNNSIKGSSPKSDHMYGCAADITAGSKKANRELFAIIVGLANAGKILCRQIIDEYGYSWIHVSINNTHNDERTNQILHLG